MARLSVLSGKEVCKILARHGFVEVRRRGSHVVMKKVTATGERGCVIPMHKEVSLGTLRSALKLAGVGAEDFIAALR